MDNTVETPQNVIVTSSLPPSNAASIWPYPLPPQSTDEMSAPSDPPESQFSAHQAPPQSFAPALHHQPIQRSHSVANAPSVASTPSPFNMDVMQRSLPVLGPGYHPQALPVASQHPLHPSRHSHHTPQGPPPPTHAPLYSKSGFQTGPSSAAVAYQITQQMQQHQSGLSGALLTDMYNHNYQQSPTYYTYGQQPYAAFPPEPEAEVLMQMPYPASYPPPSYSVSAGPAGALNHAGQAWYPLPQQQQQPAQYYYTLPMNYAQQPLHMLHGPVDHAQPYPAAPEQPRRHSVPRRKRGPGLDGIGPSVRGVAVDGSKSTPNLTSSTSPQPSAPSLARGPPRKPRQTGYALWVGNLPVSVDVAALKDHFSLCCGHELESVRIIPTSNCGFVNYRTEAARNQAMLRFNNARFKGIRLVCRLRPRGHGASATGATDSLTPPPHNAADQSSDKGSAAVDGGAEAQDRNSPAPEIGRAPPTGPSGARTPRTNAKFRYFILKSITVEDIKLSQNHGTWATQKHNEAALNQAFEAAESVFLIFSANRSGQYCGYARMTSKISNVLPDNGSTNRPPDISLKTYGGERVGPDAETPKETYTAATETARKGRIVDDSARGCVFWEALSDDDDESGEEDSEIGKTVPKVWGRPFRVEWLCTSQLPFHQTRGIRNSLNGGREVKIARDGTELDEYAGRRLLHMFHQLGMT